MIVIDPRTEAEIIRRAEEALVRLGQTFDHWMEIARALDLGRQQALAETGANSPQGALYSGAFSRWLKQHPKLNDKKLLPGSTRHWLFKCFDHEGEIREWRNSRGGDEIVRYNFPETVFKRWAREERPDLLTEEGSATSQPKPKLLSQTDQLKAENSRLQQEVLELQAKLRRYEQVEGDQLLITRHDRPADILRVLQEEVPNKLTRMWTLMGQQLKSTTPKPRRGGKPKTEVQPEEIKVEGGLPASGK
jgi:hypothetical protein